MKTIFIKQHSLAAACALALGVLSGTAVAQVARPTNDTALVTDTRGGVVTSGFGLCVHNAFGPPAAWNEQCDGPRPVALYIAPAPAQPAPVYLAAAAPLVVYEKVAFDTNVLFDSDKYVLLPAGRQQLDQFADKIYGLDSESIVAIGYADRMGTDASNQVLSQNRVDAVKAYLVAKGISSNRMDTSAKGESQPTTYAGECKDANNAKNVACMQPDRHVSITVSGTRVAR